MVSVTRPVRTLSFPRSFKHRLKLPGQDWTEETRSYEYPMFWSFMGVEKGPKTSPFATREVYHSTIETTTFNGLRVMAGPGFSGEYVDTFVDFLPWSLGQTHSQCISFDPGLLGWQPDMDTLVDRAVDGVYQPPSLINFLLELDDIPNMLDSLRSGVQWATSRRGRRYLQRLSAPRTRLRVREDVVDPLGNGVLTTNLGLLPLWSDLEGFLNLAARLQADYRNVQYQLTSPEGMYGSMKRKATYTREFDVGWCKFKVHGTHTRRYGARISADISADMPFVSQDSWAASGINWDLQTLWNATPFSFLIDYVVPIGDALRSSRIFSNPRILDSWVTDKIEGSASFETLDSAVEWNVGTVLEPGYWGFNFRYYWRRPSLWDTPDGTSVRDISLVPNPRQLANTLSLLNNFVGR